MRNWSVEGVLKRYEWTCKALIPFNSLFCSSYRVGSSPGNPMAQNAGFCGLQLEAINHGISLEEPDQTVAKDWRWSHLSCINQRTIKRGSPWPCHFCNMPTGKCYEATWKNASWHENLARVLRIIEGAFKSTAYQRSWSLHLPQKRNQTNQCPSIPLCVLSKGGDREISPQYVKLQPYLT